MPRLDQQLAFVTEIGQLKGVLRQTRLAGLDRRENSAEHSWHLALMALALAEHAPGGTDLGKVIAMVLIHDVVEIDAGDLFVYADENSQQRQDAAEAAAADRIFAILPADQASSLRRLWDEFTERRSSEARFARALDRLQPMLENLAAGGGTWQIHAITADQVLEKVKLIDEGSPSLGQYARDLVARAVETGILAPASQISPDPAAPDPAAPDPAAPDPAGPDPAGPDPAGPDPAGPDPAGPDPAAPEPAALDITAPDPPRRT
jgi:putative hydrolase of HD superfamily